MTSVSGSIPKLGKGYALGAIQHTHEKKERPVNKRPGKKVHKNIPAMAYRRNR